MRKELWSKTNLRCGKKRWFEAAYAEELWLLEVRATKAMNDALKPTQI